MGRFETLNSKVPLHAQVASTRIQKHTQRSYLNSKRRKKDEAKGRGVKPQTKNPSGRECSYRSPGWKYGLQLSVGQCGTKAFFGTKLNWRLGDREGNLFVGCIPVITKS